MANPFETLIPERRAIPKPEGVNPFDSLIPPASPAPMNALGASNVGAADWLIPGADELFSAAMTPIELGQALYQGKQQFSDEAWPAIQQAYTRALQKNRALTDQAQDEHPIAYGVGATGGALTLGGTASKGGLTLAGKAAPTILGQGLAGAGEGAIYSALYGFGAGEGAADRVGKAFRDAALGGATGGALGMAIPAAAQGWSAVRNRMKGNMPSRAQKLFAADMTADAPNKAASKMVGMGPDARAYDVGPNAQSRAGGLAATPGRAQTLLRQDVGTRKAGAGARLDKATSHALGESADMLDVVDDIVAKRKRLAGPLYKKAFEQGDTNIWSQELSDLTGSPSFAEAMGRGVKKWKDSAIESGYGAMNPPVTVTPDGRIVFNRNARGDMAYPDLRFWDATKRSLDDMIGLAKRSGEGDQYRTLTGLKRQLVSVLDKKIPNYKAARQAFEGESAMLDAAEDGAKVFTNQMTPGQLKRHLDGLNASEREAFTTAARSKIADQMGFARNDALEARRLFDKGYNKEKLAMLVGKQKADRLIRNIDTEKTFDTSLDVITRNSETARRQVVQQELGARGRGGDTMLESFDVTAPGRVVQKAWDKILGNIRKSGFDKSNEELARLLMTRDPSTITKVIKAAQGAAETKEISAEVARKILTGIMAPAATQAPKMLP